MTPKNPLEDKTQWDLPLVEIDGLLPGHTYRFRLIERGSNEPEILGGTYQNPKVDNYRENHSYLFIPLLMSSLYSYLSNKPK